MSKNRELPEVSLINADKNVQLAELLMSEELYQIFWFELVELGLVELVGSNKSVDFDRVYEWIVHGLIYGTERGPISYWEVHVAGSELQGKWLTVDRPSVYFKETLNDIIGSLERDSENYGVGALECYQAFVTGELEDDEEIMPYSELGAYLIAEEIASNQWKDKDPQWRPNPDASLAHWGAVPTENLQGWLSSIADLDPYANSGCDARLVPEEQTVAGWSQTSESTRNEIFELLRHGFNPENLAEPQSIYCRYFLECISVHPATTSEMKAKIG